MHLFECESSKDSIMEAFVKMALKFYRYNPNIGADEYKLNGTNAKLQILESDEEVLKLRLITDPSDKRKFCDAIISSFEQIVEEFGCTTIIFKVGANRTEEVTITRELVQDPEELLKVYRKKSVSLGRASA